MSRRNLLRKVSSQKGDYGHVLIVAGSRGMAGAAVLATEGALRSGAGRVTLATSREVYPFVARRLLEAMTLPLKSTRSGSVDQGALRDLLGFASRVQAVAIGPGLGTHPSTRRLVTSLIRRLECPIVLDADGINGIRGHAGVLRQAKKSLVLTPHPGELAGLIGISTRKIQSSRKEIAKKFSAHYDCILVLKGHHSVVAEPGGKVFVNRTGNPGMASGGMGDVLTGMIASFVAQGFDPFFAARLGVYVHGKAGDEAARKMSATALLARDVLNFLPPVLKRLEGRRRLREIAVNPSL